MILVNGLQADSIAADDRGLAYGDGLFETIEISRGRPLLWRRHWQRLSHGCDVLAIDCPDEEILQQECLAVARDQVRGIVKIIITRGSGGRGYRPELYGSARRIVSAHDWPEYPEQYKNSGIRLFRCEAIVSENKQLAGLKTLCRVEQVLAQMEWQEPAYAEGLMMTLSGHVIEGTRTNLFIVKNGRISTPKLNCAGIKGIMREVIIEMAIQSGMVVEERLMDHDDVMDADEIFLCNSILKIWPVREYLDKVYRPGECTKRLMTLIDNQLGDYE